MALILAGIGVMLSGAAARGGDIDERTIPGKWLNPLLPENAPEPAYPDYDAQNFLEKARLQLEAGQYRRALVTLQLAGNREPIDAALIAGEARLELGRYDEALFGLTAPDAGVQTLRARVLAAQGNYQQAIDTLQKIIDANPELIPPHYYIGAYREAIGDIAGAKSAYEWFVSDPHNFLQQWISHPETFNSASDVTAIGRAVDRWATLTMAYQSEGSLHDIVLSMFVRAYDLIDRDYWPAHVAAAEYMLLHDNPGGAMEELDGAMAVNPSDVQAWTLTGRIALQQFNFDAADKAVAEIRKVNPDSIDADLLEARNFMAQRVPKLALPLLQGVLQREPQNVEALGLMAGVQSLLLADDKAAEILKQVDALQPNNASAYFEVAEQLGSMRQYPRAEAMYKIAVDRAPWWAAARNGLGLLYTQSGDEDSARVVLEAAHSLDPFNVRTTNYLRLLDMMDGFARKESAHFIVLYDAQQDPIIPEYFSDYLESVYPAVCGAFEYEPKVKTMIEVFPTHDAFSVRTTGSPWIATVGASTGRVIALVSPRKGALTLGTFNFSQVLRHEFTHTVTLGATDNRIPLWFTEGLAVQEEHTPVRWEWVPMLYRAVTRNEMFDLDSLTWAFVRPRRPIDRQLAYAESSWICQYIEETRGHAAILRMLAEFRAGRTQDEVFRNALKIEQGDFYSGFCQWCRKQVGTWGYDEATDAKYAALRDQGEDLIRQYDYVAAVPVFEEIVRLRPMDVLPHQRLAGLYGSSAVNELQKSAEQLDILARVELNNNMYAKGAARIYRNIGQLDKASARALQAVYIAPYDRGAHQLLGQIDRMMGKTVEAAKEDRVIEELDDWQRAAATGDGESTSSTDTPAAR
ncbi:MAG: tetratricopeptide repeat protein [Tepidisphaeraceae bacterium]